MATRSSVLAWRIPGTGEPGGLPSLVRRPWGFSPEARRGSQGASPAAPGKSGLHARGEGERVLALESSRPRDQTCISCIGRQILYH